MPLVFLEQLPLPSLQSYVTVSVLLFVSAILYSLNVTIGSGESDVPKIYDFMSQDNFCFWVSMFTTALIRRYYFTPNRFVLTFALSMFNFSRTWIWPTVVYFCSGKLSRELCLAIFAPVNYRWGQKEGGIIFSVPMVVNFATTLHFNANYKEKRERLFHKSVRSYVVSVWRRAVVLKCRF